MILKENNGISVAEFAAAFDAKQVAHGFSTRREDLNMSVSSGEPWEAIHSNRRRFLASLGLDYSKTVWTKQVHGSNVVIADENTRPSPSLEADAILTDRPNIPLFIVAADCVPILLWDPARRVIGAAHAGWRGTAIRVVTEAVKAMEKAFGSLPQDIHAGIGPSIGPCCYEVGEEVVSVYDERFPGWPDLFAERYGSKAKLSLWESNRKQLIDIGLTPENIEMAGSCTACNTDIFYSERKEGRPSGRFCGVISLV